VVVRVFLLFKTISGFEPEVNLNKFVFLLPLRQKAAKCEKRRKTRESNNDYDEYYQQGKTFVYADYKDCIIILMLN